MQIVTDMAGAYSLIFGNTAVHFWLDEDMRYPAVWGYKSSWYDGPVHEFGLGRLLLVCVGP
jgi:hypothetical protein